MTSDQSNVPDFPQIPKGFNKTLHSSRKDPSTHHHPLPHIRTKDDDKNHTTEDEDSYDSDSREFDDLAQRFQSLNRK